MYCSYLFPLHTDGGLISSRLSVSDSILLQLLRGEVLLQVALVARQWQAVCDAGQEGHRPTVLLQLSGLLLHMHLVAGGESNQLLAGRIKRVIKVLLCPHSPATSSGTPAQCSTALPWILFFQSLSFEVFKTWLVKVSLDIMFIIKFVVYVVECSWVKNTTANYSLSDTHVVNQCWSMLNIIIFVEAELAELLYLITLDFTTVPNKECMSSVTSVSLLFNRVEANTSTKMLQNDRLQFFMQFTQFPPQGSIKFFWFWFCKGFGQWVFLSVDFLCTCVIVIGNVM